MEQISSLDLHYLVKELKFLENQRLDTFYYSNEKIIFKIYVKTKGNFFLIISPGEYLYLNNEKDFISEKHFFSDYLRKYLKNSFVKKVQNVEKERILILELSKIKNNIEKTYKLIIEVFKPGNIILVNEEDTILNSLYKKRFKDREILVNQKYEFPPLNKIELNKELIKDKESKLVKFLAKEFNLGGRYSEELIIRLKLDKNKLVKNLNDKEIEKIKIELKNIYDYDLDPRIIKNEKNEIIKFLPFYFFSLQKYNQEKLNSFSEAVKLYFNQFNRVKNKKEEEINKKIKSLNKRLDILYKQKDNIIKEYEKYNNIGNKIYENYNYIEKLIKLGKKLEDNEIDNKDLSKGIEKLKEKYFEFTKNEIELIKFIKKIDRKEKYLEVSDK